MSSANRQDYRPDIDGLRAVAVLSVILFHINETLLPGGFIGVDIFFVISGYLISLYIFKEIECGRFSLVEFYRRRVKRIAPAMLVVVAATMLSSQFLFRPEDAELIAESGVWSLLSLANVYFWLHQDTSYFAAASAEQPLLHLWSLGVEEQFYIFWPLILMLTYSASRGRVFFIASILIAIVSFLLGELLFDRDPSFVYYMLPSRAGELILGALAAQLVLRWGTRSVSSVVISWVAVAGFILVAGSLVFVSKEKVVPGLLAVPPTLGAAMLILAGHYGDSWPTRLLKLRPMIWIGLISYSAYLWHWPLLAFFRYGQPAPGALAGSVIFALTILFAWLSYRCVEQPARRSHKPAIHVFARQYVVPAAALSLLGLVAMKLDGYGLRWLSTDYNARLAAVREITRPGFLYDYLCQRKRINAEDINNDKCVVGAEAPVAPVAILWGDSHAAQYTGLVGAFAREQGFRFRNLAVEGCPPVEGDPAAFVYANRLSDCRESLKLILQTVDSYPVVIISAQWTYYHSLSGRFLEALFDMVRALTSRGKLVIIIGTVPFMPAYDRLCLEKALSFPFMECHVQNVPVGEQVASMHARLKAFADATPGVAYYDVIKYLCPNEKCAAFDETGEPLYYDRSHINLSASWKMGNDIIRREGVPVPFTLIANWPRKTTPITRNTGTQ